MLTHRCWRWRGLLIVASAAELSLPHLKKIGMLVLRILPDAGAMRVVNRWDQQSLASQARSLNHQHHFASFLASVQYRGCITRYTASRFRPVWAWRQHHFLALSKVLMLNHERIQPLMDWGCCFLLAPDCGCVGRLSGPLTVSLFRCSKFTAACSLMTQRALIAYSVG